ncbi:Cytochrome P450 monooxygenase yanH [Lachnellula suecica]|uniref:Cytochrome P450 monooxygenase yanH n=1 Tax=Lachnellula suecica TaxID=602035 RepID=A0A8T9CDN0_9HELO|nr:Cytochrome P450 monooxygenase yanH [Lachnellula suecica]
MGFSADISYQVRFVLSNLESGHFKKLLIGVTLVLWGATVTRGLYNVTLHPLANFPGPFWAGLTPWWKTYEEFWIGTSMLHRYRELHAKHGPVIRISPNELSFGGPILAYDEIYNARFDKDLAWQKNLGTQHSTFGRPTVSEAKRRRDLLLPFFSRRSILALEHVVQEKTDILIAKLLRQHEEGVVSDLHLGYSCYTVDIITDFCFAQSAEALSFPDFHAPLVDALLALADSWSAMKHFPILQKINSLPTWLSLRIAPAMKGFVEYQTNLQTQINDLIANPYKLKEASHAIIYETLLAENKEQGTPLTFVELDHEAQSLVAAGVDTTMVTLVTGTYELLKKPEMAAKLRLELKYAWPSLHGRPLGLEALERLPYLAAVIKESLRTAPHITAGFPRIVPDGGKEIGGVFVPGGAKVSMSVLFPHNDPTIFADPQEFKPERWLLSSKETTELEQFLVPFSHGPRACLGRPLAYAELFLAFANVFRKIDLQLTETTPYNMEWKDNLVAHYPNGHLRARARRVQN